jgi:hypothetical protein
MEAEKGAHVRAPCGNTSLLKVIVRPPPSVPWQRTMGETKGIGRDKGDKYISWLGRDKGGGRDKGDRRDKGDKYISWLCCAVLLFVLTNPSGVRLTLLWLTLADCGCFSAMQWRRPCQMNTAPSSTPSFLSLLAVLCCAVICTYPLSYPFLIPLGCAVLCCYMYLSPFLSSYPLSYPPSPACISKDSVDRALLHEPLITSSC